MKTLNLETVVFNYHSDLNGAAYARDKEESGKEIIVSGPILREAAGSKSEYVSISGPLHENGVDIFTVTPGLTLDENCQGDWPLGQITVRTKDIQKALIVSMASEVIEAAEKAMDLGENDYHDAWNNLFRALTSLNSIKNN